MAVKTTATAEKKAVVILSKLDALKEDIQVLMEENGINEMLAQVESLKKEAVELVTTADIQRVDMPDGSYYALRRDAYNKRIVGDADDLSEVKNPVGVVPLKKILQNKFGEGWLKKWQGITSRKVDEAKLTKAVATGELTLDEIQPAYYQDTKTPYLRKYGG